MIVVCISECVVLFVREETENARNNHIAALVIAHIIRQGILADAE